MSTAFNTPTHDPTQGNGGRPTQPAAGVRVGNFSLTPEMIEDMIKNPQLAYQVLRAYQGKGVVDRGYGANVRESKFGQALAAYLAAVTSGSGAGALDNVTQHIGSFNDLITSGNYFGALDQAGADMLGRVDFDTMSAEDSEQALRAGQGLRLMGTGPIGRTSLTNALDELVGGNVLGMLTGGEDEATYSNAQVKSSPFWRAYGALGGR